jgi:hypothetical protein
MKLSTFAAVVFVTVGIFGIWQILRYKHAAERAHAAMVDAGPADASAPADGGATR